MTDTPEAELYARLRDYLKHEDSLINWRLTWNFGLQSALLGAYGYLVRASVAKGKDDLGIVELRNLTDLGLPILGLAIGLASSVGVVAALRSIARLHQTWDAVAQRPGFGADWFPPLSGGGSHFARRFGCLASLVPTFALWGAWSIILSQKFAIAGRAAGFLGSVGFVWAILSKPKAPLQLSPNLKVGGAIARTDAPQLQ